MERITSIRRPIAEAAGTWWSFRENQLTKIWEAIARIQNKDKERCYTQWGKIKEKDCWEAERITGDESAFGQTLVTRVDEQPWEASSRTIERKFVKT